MCGHKTRKVATPRGGGGHWQKWSFLQIKNRPIFLVLHTLMNTKKKKKVDFFSFPHYPGGVFDQGSKRIFSRFHQVQISSNILFNPYSDYILGPT